MALTASKQAFFERYAPQAMEQQQKYGIPASVTLAQMYIESSGGTSRLAKEGNNYFGIKCPPGWISSGKPYSLHSDDKPNEKFCNYASVSDSLTHHSQFLMGKRYAQCQQCASDDYVGWSKGLKAAGYATAPNYAEDLIRDIRAYGLDKYDRQAIADAQKKGVKMGYMRGRNESVSKGNDGWGSSKDRIGFHADKPTKRTGNFSFPIAGDQLVVTSGFGHRNAPVAGASSNHNGLDLRAKYVPVMATENRGRVSKIYYNEKGGYQILIIYDRPDGSKIRVGYAHLDGNTIKVKEGDIVNASTVIAHSGASGLAGKKGSGPHLHFTVTEIDGNGKELKIDPTKYLAEIAVMGNLSARVVKKGDASERDLLASYKNSIHPNFSGVSRDCAELSYEAHPDNTENTHQPDKTIGGAQLQADAQPQQKVQEERMKRLSELTQSNNPADWLKLLALQNGDLTLGGSGDIIADLIGLVVSSAFMISSMMGGDSEDSISEVEETEEERQQNTMRREQEGIDPKKAQSLASMYFDSEYPEHQSQNQRVHMG